MGVQRSSSGWELLQIMNSIFFFYLSALILFLGSVGALDRRNFPAGFVFGASSSAYQYEGGSREIDRGRNIWDTFIDKYPEKIADHSNADVANDFYHRFRGDIAMMKEVGLDSFRLSFSWARILPKGRVSGGVNGRGVQFYNSVIDELIFNGIRPLVTLFHWDFPQALEDEYLGFLRPNVVDDFVHYVDFCFGEFGDRVKNWITINEANTFSSFGYATGLMAPGRCSKFIGNCPAGNSGTEPYIVTHNILLSHAAAVKLYREKYKASQNGEIGIILASFWMVPKWKTADCKKAAIRALDFNIGWIANPITYGEYPETMRSLVGKRLPNFTEAEAKMVKGSIDFFGVNYYTARYAEPSSSSSVPGFNFSYSTDSHVNLTTEKDGIPIGLKTCLDWLYVYPRGLKQTLKYIKKRYNDPQLYVTENGVGDPNNRSIPIEVALNDHPRIQFISQHLHFLLQAIQEGVRVKGYYVWTFLDDFEWQCGYIARFGFTYVDFSNGLQRYFKRSAFWFSNFLHPQTLISQIPSSKYYSQTPSSIDQLLIGPKLGPNVYH